MTLKERFIAILTALVIVCTLFAVSGDFYAATITYTYDNLHRLTSIDYGNGTVTDYTYDAAGNRKSERVSTGSINTAPAVSYPSESAYGNDGVNPDSGTASTTFIYKLIYTDANNNPPASIKVHIDGDASGISISVDATAASTLRDGNYTNGEQYYYTTSLPAGAHNYYFIASDAIDTIRLPSSGTLSGPTVSDLVFADWTFPSGIVGISYITLLPVSGGVPPYTWSILSGLPPGLTIDIATGIITGTPTTPGTYGFTAYVTDSTANTYSKAFSLTIDPSQVNNAPELIPIGANNVNEGVYLYFMISGIDPDGDVLTYSATGLPTGATLNASTGTFSWTPDYSQAGTYNVTFTVSDGSLTASEIVQITVNNVGQPPVLNPIGSKSVDEGTNLNFTISGSDPDGDPLTYSATGLPPGATFDVTTQTFNWTPDYSLSGAYSVTFTVSDGSGTVSETLTISVNDVNEVPVIFSDDFNDSSIDPINWTNISGYSVAEANGIMKIDQAVTDNGGNLISKWIDINPKNALTITRRVNAHYANNYFVGKFGIVFDQAFLVNIEYAQMSWGNYPYCSSYGFYIVKNSSTHSCPPQGDVSSRIEPVWDQWFDEKIIYNPMTGVLEYFINDQKRTEFNVGTLPTVTNKMQLYFNSWGWYTGHYHYFDDIAVQQSGVIDLSYSPESGYGSDGVNPDSGTASTAHTYKVIYTHPNNDPPAFIKVHIDGDATGAFMTLDTSAASTLRDGDYTNGEQYYYTTALAVGIHNYYFDTSNGTDTVRLPSSGTIGGPAISDLTFIENWLIPSGIVGYPYTTLLSVSGGTPPYTWSILLGLPPGLTLDSATGIITGIPMVQGIYGFTAYVTDSNSYAYSKTFSILVNPNQPPVANNQWVTTVEDTRVSITLTGSDPEGQPLTFSAVSIPSNGILNGAFPDLTYIPNSNFTGSDSFAFKVNDGFQDSNIATMLITVNDTTPPATTVLPAGGTYTSAQSVILLCGDGTGSGCRNIYYTTDGMTPTTSSSVYLDPINVSTTTTLKFFAIDNAGNSEIVKSEVYTILFLGLSGEYYNNSDLTGLSMVRIDPAINFDWGTGSPDPSIDADSFAARWTGQLRIDYDEAYTFNAVTDDGIRLWIDGHLMLDYWQPGGVSINDSMELTSGLHDVKVEFFENTGGALAQLYWSSPSTPYEIIPNDHLYPPAGAGSSPVLEWVGDAGFSVDGVEPEVGDVTTMFAYRLKYTDSDGHPPMNGFPRVHILNGGVEISGNPFTMTYEYGDYANGAVYSFNTTLSAGISYKYYFDAKDITGLQAVGTPTVPTPVAPLDNPDVCDSLNTYYSDTDGDGYGDQLVTTQACTQTSGYVTNSADCNDSVASINPGVSEVCNGINDDCDGWIDEGCPGVENNTIPGTNVVVSASFDVILTFDTVTTAGTSTVVTSGTGQPPPSGFRLGSPPIYYEISTTATYNGLIQVCFSYDETHFATEHSLRLFHLENNAWLDITDLGYPDTINNIICGTTSSFSTFIIAEADFATAGTFMPTGNMSSARRGHTATLLQDGRVLITGGIINIGSTLSSVDPATGYLTQTVFSSAEIYDPATGYFTPTGTMSTARFNHTATLLSNGTVLIVGGYNGTSFNKSSEIYDPSSGTFSETGSLGTARYGYTATPLNDGTVLIIGGAITGPSVYSSAEIYNPTTGSFAYTGSMNAPRSSHTATLLNNGKVLVVGGSDYYSKFASAEIYDPYTKTFTNTGSMTNSRFDHSATLLEDGKVLIAGGHDNLSSAELYDPATGLFTATGSLNNARAVQRAVMLNNGEVLLVGGNYHSSVWEPLITTELYNTAIGIFNISGNMNSARAENTTTLLKNGLVLIAGGYSGNNGTNVLSTAELYIPSTTLSLDISQWMKMECGPWGNTAEGLKVYGTYFRGGNLLKSKSAYNFIGKELFIKWKVNNGGSFSAYGLGLFGVDLETSYSSPNACCQPYTKAITNDTWYYTRIKINPDKTAQHVTSTNDYDINGGTVFSTGTKTISDAQWQMVDRTNIVFQSGDSYAGSSSYFVIGEVITDATPVTFNFGSTATYDFEDGSIPASFNSTGNWTIANDGYNSLRSLYINTNQNSNISLDVTDAVAVSFKIRVNAPTYSGAGFAIIDQGNTEQGYWWAGQNFLCWNDLYFNIYGSGTKTLRWDLFNNGSGGGEAWIDDIKIYYPVVTEVCDGIDNDGDGLIDEGFPDTDGDGQADCVDIDDDNDGYTDNEEVVAGSDPLNAASTPEICDSVDNDLDGQTDEGLLTTYYSDSDFDTYGNATVTTQACTVPSGYVSDNTDCNDNDVSINPAAAEVCNGIDDNCNAQVDEGFQNTDVDSQADCVDADDDNDGVVDVTDNCSLEFNADQADSDIDGTGDVCDYDCTPGLVCIQIADPVCGTDGVTYGNSCMAAVACMQIAYRGACGDDWDGDGLPNGWESRYGLNPSDSTGDNGASGDPDGDGSTNLQEFQGGTNPQYSFSNVSKLGNISTRGMVQTGDRVMIGGFIISGTAPRSVLIRGFGPTLADFGVTGAMSNPYIELYSGQTMITTNDNWQTPITQCDAPAVSCGTPLDIQATGKDACTVATTGCTQDAAILVTLPPGAYTAIMRGVGGGTGVGLIGVDDNDTNPLSKLVNISTRGPVLTGDSVMIGGFIVGGSTSKQVLIRGFGPTLTDFGVTGALANPYVELYSGQTMISTNDDWQLPITQCDAPAVSCGTPQDIQATGKDACTVATTGCSQDAAILVTLPPGAYTAIVRGVNNSTGVGLVGIDEIVP